MSPIDFGRFEAMTFDCYGTLVDWEAGILNGLQPVLSVHDVEATPDQLLESYGRHEAAFEAGPYLPYRTVLAASVRGVCADLGIQPTDGQVAEFADSVGNWPAFGDTAAALRRLARRFKLGVITNCDDDLFARTNRRLGVKFDWVVTAQQAQGYKPRIENFKFAFSRMGLPPDRILHVAQSLFHDHVPAKSLGMTTVWVNRRHDRPGFGATPEATASPDLEVPDMRTLAELAAG